MGELQFFVLLLAGMGASLHCVSMCGLFAGAAGQRGGPAGVLHAGLYSTGRIISYATLGGLAGLLGRPLLLLADLNRFQAVLSVVLGVLMLVMGLHMVGLLRTGGLAWLARGPALAVRALAPLLPPRGPLQALSLGLINGLLPCPVVHGFLPVALAAGSFAGGMAVMGTMGLGTVPAMLAVSLVGRRARRFAPWLQPVPGLVVILFGLVTILRVGLLAGGQHLHTM